MSDERSNPASSKWTPLFKPYRPGPPLTTSERNKKMLRAAKTFGLSPFFLQRLVTDTARKMAGGVRDDTGGDGRGEQ